MKVGGAYTAVNPIQDLVESSWLPQAFSNEITERPPVSAALADRLNGPH